MPESNVEQIDPLIKAISDAKGEVAQGKETRAELWKELDACLLQQEPLLRAEREIRARIVKLQQRLFALESAL